MQSDENWFSNNSVVLREFKSPGKWSIVIQWLVRMSGVVVVEILGKESIQVCLVEDDDMVEAIPAD